MAVQRDRTGARPKIKEEMEYGDYATSPGRETDFSREYDHMLRLKQAARRMAADAGFGARAAHVGAGANTAAGSDNNIPDVNKHGGALCNQLPMKTPKYSGKADWEAFYAQFELLARAAGWSEDTKALQLALCLTDEASHCLLLLSPEERGNFQALVGALQQRFGQFGQPAILRSELANRQRRTDEPLRVLASDIEALTRRAYPHMPAAVQAELARDQFIRALSPRDLRVQTQLAHPCTLREALETALERELVGAAAENGAIGCNPVVRVVEKAAPDPEEPGWVQELTELIRTVAVQPPKKGSRFRRDAPVCWVCGQAGHISVRCPKRMTPQGNGPGSV